MLITNSMAKSGFEGYFNKDTKLSREVKNKKLFKIINGLYETDINTPAYLLAGSIYGSSYISFEYALSFYGLISERVNMVTCATFSKKKKKQYKTQFGIFHYRVVPDDFYPCEVLLREDNDYSFQIASAEKALCDKLYILSLLNNYNNLEII